MQLKKYDKKFDFSYTYGTAPTIDLLRKRPELVKTILLHPDGETSDGVEQIKDLCNEHNIRFEFSPKAIKSISAKENTYTIGVFRKYVTTLSAMANHIVLVNPSNPGNLGTIIRSMIGFDFSNLAIIRPAADIFDPKVVRSSMGSSFDLNFEYFDNFDQYIMKFRSHNLYPFMLEGKNDLRKVSFKYPFSLIFGKESSGLQDSYGKLGTSVYIPCSKNIDSLNLSIAVSIAMYVTLK